MISSSLPPMIPFMGPTSEYLQPSLTKLPPESTYDVATPTDPVYATMTNIIANELQTINVPTIGPVYQKTDAPGHALAWMNAIQRLPSSPAAQLTIKQALAPAYTDVAKREAELARLYAEKAAKTGLAVFLGTIALGTLIALALKA